MKKVIFLLLFVFVLCGNSWADMFRGTVLRGADDGDEACDSWCASNGYVDTANVDWCVEFMQYGAVMRWAGAMRFSNVTIPQGSTINSAYIQLINNWGYRSACCSVSCHNVDSATIIEGGNSTFDLSERWTNPTTKIFWHDWMNYSTVYPDSTCDLKIPLQDIINRPGWKSGNAVMFIFKTIRSASSCTSYYEPYSYEGGAKRESLLVDYTPPITGDTITYMRLPGDWRFRSCYVDSTNYMRAMDWRFQDTTYVAGVAPPPPISPRRKRILGYEEYIEKHSAHSSVCRLGE